MVTAMSKQPPIKILHVLGRMSRGGAEVRTVELMHYIDRDRYLPHFLSLSGQSGQLDDEIRSLGSEVYLCKLGRGFARRFTALLKKEKYDIVHSHVHFSSGYILRLAEKAGVRGRITHLRSTRDGRASTPRRVLQRIVSRWLVNRHSTHILAVGTGTITALFGEKWSENPRRMVLYDGVDESLFSEPPDRAGVRREFGLADDCPMLIHVGNLHEPKNHPFLISVFHEIKKRLPMARLLLVGHGQNDTETQIRAQVDELNLGDSVIFAGSRSDVPRLLMAADLMVFPSKWEGLSGVVLEASAAGVPVIGSDIPGIAELTLHLPQVQCLGLDRSAEEWAEASRERILTGYEPDKRKAMQEHFAASPFTVKQCASATRSIWQQAAKVVGS